MTRHAENSSQICTDSFPTSISNLQFSSNSHNFSSTLSSLKRSALSTHNRIRSIQHDSKFVQSVASRRHLPLIANERCGSWYIPPENKANSAYFKSTDGHFGEWAFSMRRLNLQIFATIGAAGGCVIVDSTRRGKSMPDALSKTVPIWCVVLNKLLFPDHLDTHQLLTPARAVSPSEHAQIESKLQGFVEDAKSLQLDTGALRDLVKKPILPSWITPDFEDRSPFDANKYKEIICCTASRRVDGFEASEDGYVQGAADDHEAWSQGLTPLVFWEHRDVILDIAEDDLGNFIRSCKLKGTINDTDGSQVVRIDSTCIYIAKLLDNVQTQDYSGVIRISSEPCSPLSPESEQPASDPSLLKIQCKPGKLGSRALRAQLPSIISFLTPLFTSPNSPRILVMCQDGKDLSVGVVLAILCLFYDEKSQLRQTASWEAINKTSIRRQLAKITSSKPDASPSRATLQSVHAFLMP